MIQLTKDARMSADFDDFAATGHARFKRCPPTRRTTSLLKFKLISAGSIVNVAKKLRRTIRTDETIVKVAIQYTKTPELSLSRGALALSVSKTSLWRMLREDLQWKPYRAQSSRSHTERSL